MKNRRRSWVREASPRPACGKSSHWRAKASRSPSPGFEVPSRTRGSKGDPFDGTSREREPTRLAPTTGLRANRLVAPHSRVAWQRQLASPSRRSNGLHRERRSEALNLAWSAPPARKDRRRMRRKSRTRPAVSTSPQLLAPPAGFLELRRLRALPEPEAALSTIESQGATRRHATRSGADGKEARLSGADARPRAQLTPQPGSRAIGSQPPVPSRLARLPSSPPGNSTRVPPGAILSLKRKGEPRVGEAERRHSRQRSDVQPRKQNSEGSRAP